MGKHSIEKFRLTPTQRRLLYTIGIAISGALAARGYIDGDISGAINTILAAILGIAAGNAVHRNNDDGQH
jgi:hypothetical protein